MDTVTNTMPDHEPKQTITITGGNTTDHPHLVPVPYAYGCCPNCGYRGRMQ